MLCALECMATFKKALPISELLNALHAVYRGERVIGEPRAITQILGEFEKLTKEQERVRSGLAILISSYCD